MQDNLLHKFRREKTELMEPFLEQLCGYIDSDVFRAALVDLGLMDGEAPPAAPAAETPAAPAAESDVAALCKLDKRLTFAARLCSPPAAAQSALAAAAEKMFAASVLVKDKDESFPPTDMTVVLHCEEDGEDVEIPCHRVILAARCQYFKRALTSGMREDIER